MKMKNTIWFAIICLITFVSCSKEGEKGNNKGKKEKKDTVIVEEIKFDRHWNDVARFVSGLEPLEGSAFDTLKSRAEFKMLKTYMDKAWQQKEDSLLSKLRKWGDEEFPKEKAENGTVFYPFSGPDFMTINTLFPNAKKYIFFGLEREGTIPDSSRTNKMKAASFDFAIKNMKYSLRSIMDLTFFVTREMQGDFLRSEFNGSMPVILAFMARTGNEVLDIQPIILKNGSKTAEVNPNPPIKFNDFDPQRKDVTGIRIKFRKGKGKPVQELEYFSVDVEDKHMKTHPQVIDYVLSHKPTLTYAKAASYLMHYEIFTTIRNVVLNTSKFMLQDDSGIAYRYFAKDAWDLDFYGKYDKPKYMFSWCFQNELKKIYGKGDGVKDIDFGMGYTSSKHNCNLMIARKTGDVNLDTDPTKLPTPSKKDTTKKAEK